MCFEKKFLLFCLGCIFHFIDGVLWSTNIFNFDELLLTCFSSHGFGGISKKSLPSQRSQRLKLTFSSKDIVLVLTFRTLILFNFCMWFGGRDPNSFLCVWISSSLSTIYWKDYYFPMICLDTLDKNQLTKNKDLVLDSQFYFTDLSIHIYLYADSTILITVVSFEMRKCESSKFVLFQVLAILGLLNFCMNFKISSLYLKKSQIGFLLELNWLWRSSWRVWTLNKIKSSNTWDWDVFPLFF